MMGLKKVVGANVTHIAEKRYRNFNGVKLNNDSVIVKAAKKRTPEDIRKEMTLGYMKMLSK